VLWPSGFDLVDIDGPITVIGSGQTLHLGDWVTTGGGAYDMSDFSVTGVEILSAECAGGGVACNQPSRPSKRSVTGPTSILRLLTNIGRTSADSTQQDKTTRHEDAAARPESQ